MTIAPSPRIRVRAIAFDLDGTLLDTIHDLAMAINLMLARLNQPALPKDTIRAMVGKGMANLVRRALAASQGSPPTTRLKYAPNPACARCGRTKRLVLLVTQASPKPALASLSRPSRTPGNTTVSRPRTRS